MQPITEKNTCQSVGWRNAFGSICGAPIAPNSAPEMDNIVILGSVYPHTKPPNTTKTMAKQVEITAASLKPAEQVGWDEAQRNPSIFVFGDIRSWDYVSHPGRLDR